MARLDPIRVELKLQAPSSLRAPVNRSAPMGVDRDARTIAGVSAITSGVEALGHGLWIDDALASQVAELGRAKAAGVKSRFTHPDLCSDGLGKFLGRAKSWSFDGKQARFELHLAESASKSPEGDLAEYVMTLAEEDPEAFATSIVFVRDLDAESRFMLDHGAELDGKYMDTSGFQSPDPRNVNNLPHARAQALLAVDVVDEPAANPGGFFGRGGELVSRAESFASFALGLTDAPPELASLGGLDPERARTFVSRFLSNRGLRLEQVEQPKEGQMANTDKPEAAESTPATTPKATLAELESLAPERPAFVLEQLKAGATVADAKLALAELKQAEAEDRAAAAEAKAAELQAETAKQVELARAGKLPGRAAIDFGSSDQDGPTGGEFMQLARQIRDEQIQRQIDLGKRKGPLTRQEELFRVGMKAAMKEAQKRYPEAYAEYRAQQGALPLSEVARRNGMERTVRF